MPGCLWSRCLTILDYGLHWWSFQHGFLTCCSRSLTQRQEWSTWQEGMIWLCIRYFVICSVCQFWSESSFIVPFLSTVCLEQCLNILPVICSVSDIASRCWLRSALSSSRSWRHGDFSTRVSGLNVMYFGCFPHHTYLLNLMRLTGNRLTGNPLSTSARGSIIFLSACYLQ